MNQPKRPYYDHDEHMRQIAQRRAEQGGTAVVQSAAKVGKTIALLPVKIVRRGASAAAHMIIDQE